MLTPKEIELIQDSFAKVVPRADPLARSFYAELFARAPETRTMFPTDMAGQRAKLIASLATVIQSLADVESIVPALQEMGKRHVGYGAQLEQYGVVGQCLIAALGRALPSTWDDENEAAWVSAYGGLVGIMTKDLYRSVA